VLALVWVEKWLCRETAASTTLNRLQANDNLLWYASERQSREEALPLEGLWCFCAARERHREDDRSAGVCPGRDIQRESVTLDGRD
jgi:hypothetical protein